MIVIVLRSYLVIMAKRKARSPAADTAKKARKSPKKKDKGQKPAAVGKKTPVKEVLSCESPPVVEIYKESTTGSAGAGKPGAKPAEFDSQYQAARLPYPFPQYPASAPHTMAMHGSPPQISRAFPLVDNLRGSQNFPDDRDLFRRPSGARSFTQCLRSARSVLQRDRQVSVESDSDVHRSRFDRHFVLASDHGVSDQRDHQKDGDLRVSDRSSVCSESRHSRDRSRSSSRASSTSEVFRLRQEVAKLSAMVGGVIQPAKASEDSVSNGAECGSCVDPMLCGNIPLLSKYSKPKEVGKPLDQYWADQANTAFNCELSKEDKELYVSKYLPPENLPFGKPPFVHGQIWTRLPDCERKQDVRLQAMQKAIAAPVVPLLRATEAVSKKGDLNRGEILEYLSAALYMMGQEFHLVSEKRKENLRDVLSSDYRVLAAKAGSEDAKKVSSKLLGDEFTQNLTKIREVYKGQIVKNVASASSSSHRADDRRDSSKEFVKPKKSSYSKPRSSRSDRQKQDRHEQRDRQSRRHDRDDAKSFQGKKFNRYRKR